DGWAELNTTGRAARRDSRWVSLALNPSYAPSLPGCAVWQGGCSLAGAVWKRERAAGRDTDGPSPGAGGQIRRLTSRSALAAKLAAREGKLAAILVTPESEETRTLHPRQESETPLLAVVKILIQRRQGIGIVLEPGAAGGERIGGALSALDWVFCRLFAARTECTVAARCGQIAASLVERRPPFFLLPLRPHNGSAPHGT